MCMKLAAKSYLKATITTVSFRAIASHTHRSKQRKHNCTMVKRRNNETTMLKIRQYYDEKSIPSW